MKSLQRMGSVAFCIASWLSAPGYSASFKGENSEAVIESGDARVQWNHGSKDCSLNTDPVLQVHSYNENLVILRQNKCLNYEAPFMYLIFGAERVLLLDTGATKAPLDFPLRDTVEKLIADHYGLERRAEIELIVAHSHGHRDHIAADGQFKNQPHTTLVGTTASAVANFFGIASWPIESVDFELGQRTLQIIPIPGHEKSHIAIYDAQTGILLTGDTLYPGRLYIEDWTSYRAGVNRLVDFAKARTITHVFGAHIEMSQKPGVDYPIGTSFQPNEHSFDLNVDSLLLLQQRLNKIGSRPAQDIQADFIIYPI